MKETTASVKEHHPLYEELCSIVGPKYVTDDHFALIAYTRGPTWIDAKEQGIVVKPGNTEQVSEIVKLANKTSTPIVPRGGGAPMAGFPEGAPGRGIIVDMNKMNKILYLDEENKVAAAECGSNLGVLSSYMRKRGFLVHTVAVPQRIDTLGGVLSGMPGGGWPADGHITGPLTSFVLGLEVVLPNGEVITTGTGPGTNIHMDRVIDRATGSPDITGMFIGDAGIFGIKTKAYLKVFRFPTEFTYGSYRFETFEEVWEVFSELTGISPHPYTRLTARTTSEEKFWTLLYVERAILKEELALKLRRLEEVCEKAGGEKVPPDLMATGVGVHEIAKRFAPRGKVLFFEHIVRRTDIPEFFKKRDEFLSRKLEEAGLTELVEYYTHYLFPSEYHTAVCGLFLLLDENKLSPEQKERLIQVIFDEFQFALENGAFPNENHGYATTISASAWSPTYREFMKSLKKALDPNNIMNPGLWRL